MNKIQLSIEVENKKILLSDKNRIIPRSAIDEANIVHWCAIGKLVKW